MELCCRAPTDAEAPAPGVPTRMLWSSTYKSVNSLHGRGENARTRKISLVKKEREEATEKRDAYFFVSHHGMESSHANVRSH